ncbi:interferon-induced transmembrane protein 2-like [Diretmus argenteus]
MEGGQSRVAVPSYLGWSIFNTLCCCLPLGIAAIVCSCRAQNANALGETTTAADASRQAKTLNIIGLVCGIILFIIVIISTVGGTLGF